MTSRKDGYVLIRLADAMMISTLTLPIIVPSTDILPITIADQDQEHHLWKPHWDASICTTLVPVAVVTAEPLNFLRLVPTGPIIPTTNRRPFILLRASPHITAAADMAVAEVAIAMVALP